MNKKYGIVVIAYNRVNSVERLLDSLNRVDYGEDTVDLIISIDNSGENSVENYAKSIEWNYGEKKIVAHEKRLGLKNHILKCGKFTYDYDAIAVFEDDIIAGPNFYNYMKASVEYYSSNKNVAGISLYNHLWNVHVNYGFTPEKSKFDTYFMQFAQSWGQVWMKEQWKEFEEWYEANKDLTFDDSIIPKNVCNWSERSWLKYHIAYCIYKNKYFVYPYTSQSTCFSDVGEHCKVSNTLYQVPMSMEVYKEFRFSDLDNSSIKYDAFFERQNLGSSIGINDDKLIVDLYGYKNVVNKEGYLLTSKRLDFELVKSFALQLKPHEMNIKHDIQGKDLFLYNLEKKQNNIEKNSWIINVQKFKYYERGSELNKRMIMTLVYNILYRIKEKIYKILK